MILLKEASASAVRDLIHASSEPVSTVIVDLSANEGLLEILNSLRATHPNLVLAAAHPSPSAEVLDPVDAFGGIEFLTPPFDMRHLARESKKPARAANGKLIAFLPAQSGNGASTAALHAAYAASRELNDKVLLIELDFHCSVLRERLKIEAKRSIADILEKTDQLDELWPDVVQPWNGIDLLPSPASSRTMACKSLQGLPEILDYAVSRYKAVIVDLPSALMTSTREMLAMADELYLMCTPEVTSLHLARRRASELLEMGILKSALRIVVNRAGSAQSLQTHELSQVIGLPIYRTLDNDYVALHEPGPSRSCCRGRIAWAISYTIWGLRWSARGVP